jgi:hypothetical protein
MKHGTATAPATARSSRPLEPHSLQERVRTRWLDAAARLRAETRFLRSQRIRQMVLQVAVANSPEEKGLLSQVRKPVGQRSANGRK